MTIDIGELRNRPSITYEDRRAEETQNQINQRTNFNNDLDKIYKSNVEKL